VGVAEGSSCEERYTLSEDAFLARVDEGAVVLHGGSGEYYELGAEGVLLWLALERTATPSDLIELLTATYRINAEQARHDVDRFLTELLNARLICRDPG
jgi:hypothetical protein